MHCSYYHRRIVKKVSRNVDITTERKQESLSRDKYVGNYSEYVNYKSKYFVSFH